MTINSGHSSVCKIAISACCGIILFLATAVCNTASAQKPVKLLYHWQDAPPLKSKFPGQFADTAAALLSLQQLAAAKKAEGYINFSIDSLHTDSLQVSAWLYAGQKYHYTLLSLADSSVRQLQQANLQPPLPAAGKIPADWNPEPILHYFENHGYPFAQVNISPTVIDHTQGAIEAILQIEPGTPYHLDSIEMTGSLKLKPYFLYRYLDMEKGGLFRQNRIDAAGNRLNELGFAQLRSPVKLQMLASGAVLQTDLVAKKNNIINVLIGAMPNSSQTPGNALQVTADVLLQLSNSFGHGERIKASWQQLQYKSPGVLLDYEQPYVFGSRFGADIHFELFRKDSQFLNLRYHAGVPFQLSSGNRAHIHFTGMQTSVTWVDTNRVLQTYQLPDLANIAINQLELGFEHNGTDYRLNPRRGTVWQTAVAAGIKKMTPDNSILSLKDPSNPGFNFARLYDTATSNGYQLRWQVLGEHFVPVGQFSTVKLGLQGGWLQSGEYYRNELFQVGGFNTLRGFDEQSIYVRSYAIGTLEYRLLTGQNGFFFGFADGAITQYPQDNQLYSRRYLGLGLGMRVATKTSLINLSVANGQTAGEPFDLRRTKIHLGFINFF